MSHAYFNGLWAEGQAELRHALATERKLGEGTDIPESDRINFFSQLAPLYYKWISMYKKFDEAYDQIVHPQKRPLIRKLLDVVIARLIELRGVMVGTELSEVLYFDDTLHFFSWMPSELDIPIPKYYIFDHPERQEREDFHTQLIQKKKDDAMRVAEEHKEKLAHEKIVAAFRKKLKAYEEAAEMMQPHEAISILQTYERYRQGRERMAMAKYLDMEEVSRRRRKFKSMEVSKLSPDEAATIIQKLVRGFLARQKVNKIREREMRYLGLLWGPVVKGDEKYVPTESIKDMEADIKRNAEKRRRDRQRYQKAYEEADALIESRMRLFEAPEMAERMKWQLRTWMLHIKEKDGRLPAFPKPTLGGSMGVFCPNRLPEEIQDKILEAEGLKKAKKKKAKPKPKPKKDKKGKKKKKKKGVVATKLEPMVHLEDATKFNVEYNKEWRERDETNNPDQKHEDEPIIKAKRLLVGQETRNKVDVLMKAELKFLKKALEKKKGRGGKKKGKGKGKGKSKGKGKKKGKGKRKKKGKKKKKFKDITPDRTWQSLFEELVTENIIVQYPKILLDELIGEYSLVNETIRKYFAENTSPMLNEDSQMKMPFNANPPATYGDIKRAVRDIVILPLGSETVHELVDFKKSLLIAGPPGSGKKSLVYALCTEMKATLFDLTATNIAGKYPGKAGLTMLIHLVNKMARFCQPSIILIDNAEKLFAKKVAKTDKTEPKRLKKQLKKFLKIIGSDDQLMLIGLTSEPWQSKMKPLKKTFQKFLYIPKPDHGTRLSMWQKCLGEHISDFHPHMNLPLLAKLSDNWTLGSIQACAKRVIAEHKRIAAKEIEDHEKPYEVDFNTILQGKLLFKPVRIGRKLIRMEDITNELSLIDPIFMEQEKAWNAWFNKTPLQKLRLASQRPQVKGGKKGKGKDKKSGKRGKSKKR